MRQRNPKPSKASRRTDCPRVFTLRSVVGTSPHTALSVAISAVLGLAATFGATSTANAGDILRGGATSGARPPSARSGSNPPPLASQTRANANDVLSRTTQAVQAVQAMQAAARSAAQRGPNNLGLDPNHPGVQLPNVPNGLAPGGLQVAPAVPKDLLNPVAGEDPKLWQGANLPTQKIVSGKTKVTVKQNAPQALLTWESFNIGKDTTLSFDQRAGGNDVGKWIAFNTVLDPSGVPSQILGSIEAPGQVYVINQNGIIFGGSSQINLHALVASSLPINTNLIARGLLNNPDKQFLFSQLPIATISGGSMPAFTPTDPLTPDKRVGNVVVQKGAVLSSPTTPDHVGGRIALIGANVTNAGTISTPDGQTILAAGLQVGMAAHPSTDPSLRGLDVSVGDVGSYGGTATNAGLINAQRANVTIAGKNVNQLGAINSTTSVSLNGRVDLLASYNTVRSIVFNQAELYPTATGVVTLGAGSVTQILPEWSSRETVIGAELALRSQAKIEGRAIRLGANAQLFAPNAQVTLNAGKWLPTPNASYAFTYSDGQIYLDSGAQINVAGSTDVSVPISQNIILAQLRGAELADSPLQRFGPFRGATVQLDIRRQGIFNGRAWVGTPLADASGYVGLIERTVGELTTAGGTVKLNAGESVVMQPGSTIDVSGGWTRYEGGVVETTRIASDGRLLDISQATPDRIYNGIYDGNFTTTHLKWGISETFTNPLMSSAHYEESYTYGASGGSLAINAPSVALDGKLLGNTVTGPRQRTLGPKPGDLALLFQAQDASTTNYYPNSPTPPKIVFQANASLKPADIFALDNSGNPLQLRADRKAALILSPELVNENGFGLLSIDNSDGSITVPAGVALAGSAISYLDSSGVTQHGSITLKAANISIDGGVTVPNGSLTFSAYDVSPYSPLFTTVGAQTPPYDPLRGNFTLGANALLSAAGLVVDDRSGSEDRNTLPLVLNGGTITINSSRADLLAGSTIDVSGGVAVNMAGRVTYGSGGSIVIKTGQDLSIGSVLGGKLTLGATLKGYARGKGGSLTIQAPLVQVGGATANPNTLLLTPDFFSQGGFSSFTLNGLGAVTAQPDNFLPAVLIAPGTVIEPVAQSSLAVQNADGITLTPILQPEGLRTPVSLSFGAAGVKDAFTNLLKVRGDIVMAAQAEIQTDPGAAVSFKGQTVSMLGSVFAPGGSITLSGASSFPSLDTNPLNALTTVFIGRQSHLSAAGATVITPDARGYQTGFVLGGGAISISGNIVAQAGATLDVSGASGVLDLSPAYSGVTEIGSFAGAVLVPTRVASSGGLITLTGAQELFTDATLLGAAGGPGALGGRLSVSSGRFYATNSRTTADINLIVTQNGLTIANPTQSGIGKVVTDKNGNPLPQLGHVAVSSFQGGGFNSVALGGNIQFNGPVSINTPGTLSVGSGGVIFADSAVNLAANHVVLGQPFLMPLQPGQAPFVFKQTDAVGDLSLPYYLQPTYGPGKLTVTASLIDVGNLSLQNIGKLNLIANNGDVRGDGTLNLAGDITIRAGQVYPATAVSFTIAAYDHNGIPGSVTFAKSGNRQLPLSAGGQLNVYGSLINQGGVLRAPMGTVNLGWDGTGAVPVDLITGSGLKDANGNPVSTLSIAATQQLTLSAGSVTSVSAVDPGTGQPLVIPYGVNQNGTSWIDPTGLDISTSGAPGKLINIAAERVAQQDGALIDISGGGELYAYRFISGLGGTKDILGSASSFAIIPDYEAAYAPYAPFNSNSDNFGSDPGYVNNSLSAGDRIYLNASNGLPAGFYTLLPARYALLPGAFLVTPKSGAPVATTQLSDGSSIVAGYRINTAASGQPLFSSFEVASGRVVRNRAEYESSAASAFFSSKTNLPNDSGRLVLAATQAMSIQGALASQAASGGRGGLVDISSPVDILIAGPETVTSGFNGLVLNSSELSAFGVASLLVGGVRTINGDTAKVTVTTNNLTVDNAGASLAGQDVILAANKNLTVAAGATIEQSSGAGLSRTLLFGDAAAVGSGNGLVLRVNGDVSSQIIRSGVDSSSAESMVIGAGVTISGASVTLDSTQATSLDPTAALKGTALTLNSGQISIRLDNPGALLPTTGLVLSGDALQTLQSSAKSLSLLSYSSIDLYGSGQVGALDGNGQPLLKSLALHAAEIRGFSNSGDITFNAQDITLDNNPKGGTPGTVAAPKGTLVFNANIIRLGSNQLAVDQFAKVSMNASGGILAQSTGGFGVSGDLALNAPLLTGAAAVSHHISAGGAFTIQAPAGSQATIVGGLGANLTLTGGSITNNANIVLPSGALTLHAIAGDIKIGNLASSQLDVSGVARNFFDLVKYTNGGRINLVADAGNVNVAAGSSIIVSAQAGGGSAGTLSIGAPTGGFSLAGNILGHVGAQGEAGKFSLDVSSLPGGSLASLAPTLAAGGFTQSIAIRDRNDSLVTIDGAVGAHAFSLSADRGSIVVSGQVNASGVTGGTIDLKAHGSLTLLAGSKLDASGEYYDAAGKGGAITLEAGSQTNGSHAIATPNPDGTFSGSGFLDIQTGSEINLGVTHKLTISDVALGRTTSNRIDLFNGTLHLRAPRTASGTDLQINPVNGTILNASSIRVEGYKIYDLTSSGGAITSAVQASVRADGQTFAGSAGTTTASYTALQDRLFANNAGLLPVAVIQPGAELINRTGDLTLGTETSTATSDWNLATYRFGPNSAPGVLTLRAAGNLLFYNALSDGFTAVAPNANNGNSSLWLAPLMARNTLLPINAQSWSYRLTSGADFSAADFHAVVSLDQLAAGSGSLLLGKDAGNAVAGSGGSTATTSSVINNRFQVIRTGSGDIDVSAARDVQLLNQFATIYTAGTQVADPRGVFALNDFAVPLVDRTLQPNQGGLGAIQQRYFAQYSMGGGNVTIAAQGNVQHLTKDADGNLIPDSQRQLPTNWLYRRGYIDPTTGRFGLAGVDAGPNSINDPSGSTTWWVDFSNFFEGVGALGGGNVTLTAGQDISNVDAVVPTNARMPGIGANGNLAPDATKLLELGGGSLVVRAGNNIDGGVYYVERGSGVLSAGNSITTNATRSPSLTRLANPSEVLASESWLPTTLFLGKGSFDVSAQGDLLLGPVANTFLLPPGLNNKFWYKTYFATYDATSSLNVTSLGGDVTLRESGLFSGELAAKPLLQLWAEKELLLTLSSDTAAWYQPWLRLSESNIEPFATVMTLAPPTVRATAFAGDVNVVGNLTLFPSNQGTIDLAAAGSINGLRPVGVSSGLIPGQPTIGWTAARINLSDADPRAIPGVASPFSYQSLVGRSQLLARQTQNGFLSSIDIQFADSGSTDGIYGVIQTKQALHAPGLLHANDTNPVRLYAGAGDISGLTLFSGKAAKIIAGQDITDIAFYLQSVSANDFSVVSAGRDISAYSINSPLRVAASAPGNTLTAGETAQVGDIQISGPGTLEVLAGRNIDLGTGAGNPDGTGVGITSIGNARNPYLPFDGANIIAGAGLGDAVTGLGAGTLDFQTFFTQVTQDPLNGARYLSELATISGITGALTPQTYENLSPEQKAVVALNLFYLVLRDAGRDHNNPVSPNFGTYTAGLAAVTSLFGDSQGSGDITTNARDIRTKNGGNINIFAPGGGLTLQSTAIGNPQAPPGIITEHGGGISIFTDGDMKVGISRIFTLRGGDIIIWSSNGNIAAGSSAKTVQSAPPTRVLIDPQSGDVTTDLAGLATGGGIGVLATVTGVPPGNVDLIAPAGAIDAGDAGIRVSGNLNLAAPQILNASNIQASGASVGVPTTAAAAPNFASLTTAATTAGSATNAADQATQQARNQAGPQEEVPSIITVEVLGYGGGEEEEG